MSKIRVMHVLINLEVGGTQLLVLNLAKHFSNVETYVACVTGSGPLIRGFEKCCPVYIVNEEQRSCHRSFLWFKPLVIRRLAELMQEYKIDVVQTHLFPAAIIGRAAAIIARIPVVIDTLHNLYTWKKPKDLFIDYQLSRWTDRIVCVSHAVRQFAEKQNSHIDHAKFQTIYNGVDLDHFKIRPPDWKLAAQLRLGQDDLVISSVSRLVPQKRIRDLIQVSPDILRNFPNAKFLIVGDGPQRRELENHVKLLRLKNAFRFTGFRTDVEKILSLCHIFVQLADREGFGLAMVEAMACGVPVVAALSAPIPEIITNGVDGLTIPIGDTTALGRTICLLLQNQSLHQILSDNALTKVHQKFDIQQTADALEQLYRQLLSRV